MRKSKFNFAGGKQAEPLPKVENSNARYQEMLATGITTPVIIPTVKVKKTAEERIELKKLKVEQGLSGISGCHKQTFSRRMGKLIIYVKNTDKSSRNKFKTTYSYKDVREENIPNIINMLGNCKITKAYYCNKLLML